MHPGIRLTVSAAAIAAGLSLAAVSGPAYATQFLVHNLVSDGSIPADNIDPNLVNAWGVSYSPTGPFWVSSTEVGVSTIYNGAGGTVRPPVNVLAFNGSSSPTGQVFNPSTSEFFVSNGASSARALFLFATEEGLISGWNPGLDPNNTFLGVNHGGSANYKGLALGNTGSASFLYAADFHNGVVERYDGAFTQLGNLVDPSIPSGYAPFNVQVLNGKLYVAYAVQDALAEDEVAGAGLGIVSEFNLDGSFSRQLVAAGGPLNAPWGLAIAPSSFGQFAGDLLVGNFGDGTISAFDLATGTYHGNLLASGGAPLSIDGLWAILPGNGGLAGNPLNLYFSAGPDDESHGLFGVLTAVPEPDSWVVMIFGLAVTGAFIRRMRARTRFARL